MTMEQLIKETLEQKMAVYADVCKWFEDEYNFATSKDKLKEMTKIEIEINAQISLLRFLLNNNKL